MKKNSIAALLVLSAILSTFAWQAAHGDAQGGATVSAPDDGRGKTLNTFNTTLTTTDKATLATNLGLFDGTGGVIGALPAASTATPGLNSILFTGSSVKFYLTGSTGIVIRTGTTAAF